MSSSWVEYTPRQYLTGLLTRLIRASSRFCTGQTRYAKHIMFKRVLIAVDGTAHSETVVNLVDKVARASLCQVMVMSVTHPLTDEQHMVLKLEGINPDQAELVMATQIAEHAAEIARSKGFETTIAVCFGTVNEAIVAQALNWGADLITMSTHARDGLGRIIRGSVADQVVHGSNLPVLLCNPIVQAQLEKVSTRALAESA